MNARARRCYESVAISAWKILMMRSGDFSGWKILVLDVLFERKFQQKGSGEEGTRVEGR